MRRQEYYGPALFIIYYLTIERIIEQQINLKADVAGDPEDEDEDEDEERENIKILGEVVDASRYRGCECGH
jgi:hypothetical protein